MKYKTQKTNDQETKKQKSQEPNYSFPRHMNNNKKKGECLFVSLSNLALIVPMF